MKQIGTGKIDEFKNLKVPHTLLKNDQSNKMYFAHAFYIF